MKVDLTPTLSVSRETFDRLKVFEDIVSKWNGSINLVSRGSLSDIWTRHIIDSCQLFVHGRGDRWLDLGSGGGFPGCVVAILSNELAPNRTVTMVESDLRKATFLRQALRETGVSGHVLSRRIEDTPPHQATTISARALKDLSSLLCFQQKHGSDDTVGVFPKGKTWKEEVDTAKERWQFEFEIIKSETNAEAVILKTTGVQGV